MNKPGYTSDFLPACSSDCADEWDRAEIDVALRQLNWGDGRTVQAYLRTLRTVDEKEAFRYIKTIVEADASHGRGLPLVYRCLKSKAMIREMFSFGPDNFQGFGFASILELGVRRLGMGHVCWKLYCLIDQDLPKVSRALFWLDQAYPKLKMCRRGPLEFLHVATGIGWFECESFEYFLLLDRANSGEVLYPLSEAEKAEFWQSLGRPE